jgi:hypothetical protein
LQSHEIHELEQLARRILKTNSATVAVSRKLQPCQSVDGDRVRLDSADIAEYLRVCVLAKETADPVAEAR